MYTLLLAIIYLAFISLGLPDSLLGSAWPVMQKSFDVPISYMGIISMLISGGTIVSSLLSERLTKRFGTRAVTVVSVFMTAAALFGFSTVNAFWQLCLWALPYGLGAGTIDAALNNYISLHYSSRHMSWLHCFWGVGTIVSPYVMSYALTHSDWQVGYRSVSLIQLCITVILIITLPVWNVNKSTDGGNETNGEIVGLRGALKIKGVPCLLIGFFSYCAAEATAMNWTSSYLVGTRNIPEKTAAAFASLFFIGITAGRFISGIVSERLGDHTMIRIGAAIALFANVVIFIPFESDIPALAGFVVLGVGCAPVYPSVIHSTPSNFGAKNSQAIIGIQMASAYIGSTFMPPLFGVIASHTTLRIMPIYMLAFLVLMLVMTEKTFKLTGK